MYYSWSYSLSSLSNSLIGWVVRGNGVNSNQGGVLFFYTSRLTYVLTALGLHVLQSVLLLKTIIYLASNRGSPLLVNFVLALALMIRRTKLLQLAPYLAREATNFHALSDELAKQCTTSKLADDRMRE